MASRLDVEKLAMRFVKTWDRDDDGVTAAAFVAFGRQVARACARVADEMGARIDGEADDLNGFARATCKARADGADMAAHAIRAAIRTPKRHRR